MHLWWPQVRRLSGKKNSSRSEKSQGISLRVRENLSLGKKLEKSEILRVHNYSFFLYCCYFRTIEIRLYILRTWVILCW